MHVLCAQYYTCVVLYYNTLQGVRRILSVFGHGYRIRTPRYLLYSNYVDSINVIYVMYIYIILYIFYVIIGNPHYNALIASACGDHLIFDNAFNKKL